MKEKNDDDNILLKEEEIEKTQEEEKKDSLELIKDHSKDKLIIKENNKKIDSFEILCKEKEFEDIAVDDFEDLSFKLIYENDHLLKHVISHVSEFLNKNAKNEHSNIIESLSNFINYDGFSETFLV